MVGRRKGWVRGLEKIIWVRGERWVCQQKEVIKQRHYQMTIQRGKNNKKKKKHIGWEYKDNFLQLQKILMTNLVTINLIFTKLSWGLAQ